VKKIQRPKDEAGVKALWELAEYLLAEAHDALACICLSPDKAINSERFGRVDEARELMGKSRAAFWPYDKASPKTDQAAVRAERLASLEAQCGTDHEIGDHPEDCMRCSDHNFQNFHKR
jgi:hypothetical protein